MTGRAKTLLGMPIPLGLDSKGAVFAQILALRKMPKLNIEQHVDLSGHTATGDSTWNSEIELMDVECMKVDMSLNVVYNLLL